MPCSSSLVGRDHADPHAHEDRPDRHGDRNPGGRPEPARGQGPGAQVLAVASITVSIGIITLSGFITTWLARGEGSHQLTELTGRTKVWGPLLAFPRDKFQEIFGFGLSNSSFNGLPIDSNWLASYQEQGLFGVTVCAVMLLFLLVTAYFQTRGVQRALGLFLVTYCLVASFTEVGFTDASTYLLELTLAASLLVSPAAEGRPD